MKRLTILLAVGLLGFIALGVTNVTNRQNKLHFQTIELKDTSAKLKLLEQKYDKALQQKDLDQQQLEQLQKEKEELAKQVAAKAEAKRVAEAEAQRAATSLANAVTQTKTVYAAQSYPAPSGDAKSFIYMHESGNRPYAVAPNGACGLGQALPCSKLPCGLQDYACQDSWFTNYMVQRYGSWESARSFWISHAHWNGSDWVGGWW